MFDEARAAKCLPLEGKVAVQRSDEVAQLQIGSFSNRNHILETP